MVKRTAVGASHVESVHVWNPTTASAVRSPAERGSSTTSIATGPSTAPAADRAGSVAGVAARGVILVTFTPSLTGSDTIVGLPCPTADVSLDAGA